ncbi:alpha/beta hydrolase [Hyphomicrobium sp.]|uniref:alpha/beta fold hydrolase n=1 Tax=Hyphomicrobium sp. TaxID=82 RepID=UPI000FB3ED94|nr:alpha/beta hydrolase [Hyphomicrobium sp.]RUP00610.1 MAG: alpha/beta hydrolase [Hyphomicrobium sp.]
MTSRIASTVRQFCVGIATAIALLTSGTASRAGTACTSVDGPRCKEKLSTGIEMAYIEVGPADGKPVLLIHGLTDSVRSWSLTMDALHKIDPSLHIIAVDLRGHGQSSMPDAKTCAAAPETCYRISDHASDVIAFMKAKGIGKADLAGHSMGSFVVQEIALTHPEMVGHAVLDATGAKSVGNAALGDFVLKQTIEGAWKPALEAKHYSYPAGVYELTPLDADPKAMEWIAANWTLDPAAQPSFLAPYTPETAKVRLGTWIGATKGLLAQDNTERLKSLAVPALVMWATQDSIYLAKDQEEIKNSLKDAAAKSGLTFYWKEYGKRPLPQSGAQESDIGHNIQWSAAETVAKDIHSFITTGAPTADLVYSDAAPNVTRLIVESGKAVVEKIGK